MGIYWAHVFHGLMWCYANRTAGHGLYTCYVNHHGVAFLRSGITSGSGGPRYLHWLAWRFGANRHGISPVDW